MSRKKRAETPEVLDPELSDYQRVAAHALAFSGYRKGTRTPRGSVTFAAKQAGVSRSAVHDWLNKPAFEECIAAFRAQGAYKAYDGLFLGAAMGSQAACESLLSRLERDKDPKIRLEKLRHKQRMELVREEHKNNLELIEARAKAGLPEEGDEIVQRRIVVVEEDMPPPPEERH